MSKRAQYDATYRAKHPERVAAANKAWREAHPEWTYATTPEKRRLSARKHNLKKKYGLTLEEYDAMVEAVGGVCEICGQPEEKVLNGSPASLSVDHCHETGMIRGLLCIRCNRSLHDINWHLAAIKYLEKM